jgi:short-subunit dehydrogenase
LWAEGIDVCVINPGFVDTPLTAVNDFPMPAMLSTEQAATLIRRGLERHRAVIDFPKRLTWPLRALRHLPPKWRARLLQPTVRKPDEGASPP